VLPDSMTDPHDRLAFFLATDALKEVQRANWIQSRQRLETVAEHCWHVTLLAMLFEDCAPDGADLNHVRDLLTVHDLVEIHAGDTNVWDDDLRQSQAERELAAGERLMKLLPAGDMARLDVLWREYQAQESEEARFARAIDSLHPVLMQWADGGFGHPNKAITPSRLLQRKKPLIEPYPELWALLNDVVWRSAQCGRLPADDESGKRDEAASSMLEPRLAFFFATDALKEVQRANWVYTRPRQENVAEHSWHVLLLAMLLADAAPEGVDHNHVRDLLIIHDLVEVYAGDTPIWDDALRVDEAEREMVAGERLMALLPDDILPRFDPLWREYQAQKTEEARFARAIDTLHPLLMSWSGGGHGHSNETITPAKLIERKRPTIAAYPVLWELVFRIIQDAVDRGALPADEAMQRREKPSNAR